MTSQPPARTFDQRVQPRPAHGGFPCYALLAALDMLIRVPAWAVALFFAILLLASVWAAWNQQDAT